MNTTRYFGKCKACKATTTMDAVKGNAYAVTGLFDRASANFSLVPFAIAAADGYFACNCGRAIKVWAPLKAKLSTKHECNAKCLASKGPSCECSCGGKNHGASYLAA
jgi:hypothetical protein